MKTETKPDEIQINETLLKIRDGFTLLRGDFLDLLKIELPSRLAATESLRLMEAVGELQRRFEIFRDDYNIDFGLDDMGD